MTKYLSMTKHSGFVYILIITSFLPLLSGLGSFSGFWVSSTIQLWNTCNFSIIELKVELCDFCYLNVLMVFKTCFWKYVLCWFRPSLHMRMGIIGWRIFIFFLAAGYTAQYQVKMFILPEPIYLLITSVYFLGCHSRRTITNVSSLLFDTLWFLGAKHCNCYHFMGIL